MNDAKTLLQEAASTLEELWKRTDFGEGIFGDFNWITEDEEEAAKAYVEASTKWLAKASVVLPKVSGTEKSFLEDAFRKISDRRARLVRLGYGTLSPSEEDSILQQVKKLIRNPPSWSELFGTLKWLALGLGIAGLAIVFASLRSKR